MNEPKTAEDVLPLLTFLSTHERVRLLRLLSQQAGFNDAVGYALTPDKPDEFSSEEESLAWEAEGWDDCY